MTYQHVTRLFSGSGQDRENEVVELSLGGTWAEQAPTTKHQLHADIIALPPVAQVTAVCLPSYRLQGAVLIHWLTGDQLRDLGSI